MATRTEEFARRANEAAVRYLLARDMEVLERNWTCKAGEIDIIARDGKAIVFVEVKARGGLDQGFPEDAVTAAKRERLERIALQYLAVLDEVDVSVRFDVIAMCCIADDKAFIRHHISAFSRG